MWQLADCVYTSRLLLGTAQYPSPAILKEAIIASGTQIVTVALKRQLAGGVDNPFWTLIKSLPCDLLPNTAGCYRMKEAIATAQIARELFDTHWIKLEVIGDDYTLQPNPFELVQTAEYLIKEGFEVFPYCTDDLVLCQRLCDVGCRILMPWASPIGSGKGVINPYALTVLRERFPGVTLIVDAGIGRPSHATQVMELGYEGVLINSAVALSGDPVAMASAFAKGVDAGALGYLSGMMPYRNMAHPSTPLINRPFSHEVPEKRHE